MSAEFHILIDLHRPALRQGPGGNQETLRALDMARVDRTKRLRIADIGCGTGASAILLAKTLDADVVAVDFLQGFLDELRIRAEEAGVSDRITTVNSSMDALNFAEEEFDLIWAEGAIYVIGFEKGFSYWKRFLKPGGTIVVSEITWLTAIRPAELQAHWDAIYPGIDTASNKIKIIEDQGFTLDGYFPLPESCWLDNYYEPMRSRFPHLLAQHSEDPRAAELVDAETREIELYERYRKFFSYGVYVARLG